MEIKLTKGVYHLSGRLDEHADFDPLKNAPDPLKLNIGGVTSINSIGVRRFLAFTLVWSPKKFEFFECTPEFIANINVIPQMLGSNKDETQIKSFYVPYRCEPCKRLEKTLFERAQMKKDASGSVIVPARKCASCGDDMDLDVEKNEYFLFLGS